MNKLPIVDMILDYQRTSPLSFHVPGHRNGSLLAQLKAHLPTAYQPYIEAWEPLLKIDVTELDITDDLHDPQSYIKEAQQLAADLYGVKHTFFLIGGSTVGNIASILATCAPGDYIIVQRNVHKSVINGCKLAGVNVVFITPYVDEQTRYSTIPTLEVVKEAIQRYPQAKAVFLTSPNYYGISTNLTAYANYIHKHHMLLIVDEAHGAHYGLHPNLPQSAISYGADIIIQSTHKTLPAVTMSAMLHLNTDEVTVDYMQQQLAMIESSSPSFLMLASLDIARAIVADRGKQLIEQSLQFKNTLLRTLEEEHSHIVIADYNATLTTNNEQLLLYDPLRLLVYDQSERVSGYELQQLLADEGIFAEMATAQHCIFVLHLGYTSEELEVLLNRLRKVNLVIESKPQNTLNKGGIKRVSSYYNSVTVGEPILMSRAVQNELKLVSLDEAVGERSGEMLVPYPPGIPILYSGELITLEKVDEIKHYIYHQAKFQGNTMINNFEVKIIKQTV